MASPEPADATIRALYGQVLIVSVPIESEGSTLGAYLLELDPAATDSVRPVVWGVVASVFGLTFSLALRGIPIRNRQQPNALEKAAAPKRAAMCAITQKQRLTPREQEVLRLLATTLTYQDMAAQLSVGEETIRSHVKSVLSKLGQPNRTQAVLVALKSGLLEMA